MSESTTTTTDTAVEGGEQQEQAKTFSQEDVNRIVTARLKEQAEKKFGDYNDLKTRAEGAKTVEQQLAELEQKHADAEARALRSNIAAQFGISTKKGPNGEPSDADLFLTGSDEPTLTAQAERLSGRAVEQKKQGNRAPKEGGTTTSDDGKKDLRSVARSIFAAAQNE